MNDASLHTQSAHCNKCDKEIAIKIPINVPVRLFTAWLRFIECPECGANYRHIGL